MAFYVIVWECVFQLFSSANHHSVTREWLLLLVPWLGYLFYRISKIIPYSLFFLAIGLLYKTIRMTEFKWQIFLDICQGKQVFLGRAWGLYLSIVTLGLIISTPRFIVFSNRWKYKLLPRILFISSIIWFVQCIIASHARTAWMSFIITTVLALIITIIYINKTHVIDRRVIKLMIGVSAVILSILIAAHYDTIKNRFNADKENILKIISGNDELSYTSATYRFLLYRYAYEQWKCSPFFGHGPEESEIIIAKHKNPEMRTLTHFHSFYFEILIQFGILGIILFLLAIFFLLREFLRSYFAGYIPGDYALIILCSFFMIFLWAFFNFRMLRPNWRFFWMILIGITQSMAMRRGVKCSWRNSGHPDHENQ